MTREDLDLEKTGDRIQLKAATRIDDPDEAVGQASTEETDRKKGKISIDEIVLGEISQKKTMAIKAQLF